MLRKSVIFPDWPPRAGKPRRSTGTADHLFDASPLLLAENIRIQVISPSAIPAAADRYMSSCLQIAQRKTYCFLMNS
jgi:hypothetical protein